MGVYQGQHVATVGGETLTFAMDYAAQDALRTRFGADWQEQVRLVLLGEDVSALAHVAAAALARFHAEYDHAAIMAWSPRTPELAAALAGAFRAAWYGPGAPPDSPEGKQQRAAESSALTLLLRIWRWRGAWGSARPISGA